MNTSLRCPRCAPALILAITALATLTASSFSAPPNGGGGLECQPQWLPGEGIPGTDNTVQALTFWDPDGPGPQSEVLVAGGLIFSAGTETGINGPAMWDGSTWQPLGGISSVYALAVYNGDLFAAGTLIGTNSYQVARWNGSSWVHVGGTGVSAGDAWILALAVYDGQLIAGGYFKSIGGVSATNIARWNGSSWAPLGGGVGGLTFGYDVRTLAVHNGDLYAGGHFNTAGGATVNHIARWNGVAWSGVGGGVTGQDYITVRALSSFNGELIAGGRFSQAGGVSASNIARWNGTSWSAVGDGLPSLYGYPPVLALAVHGGKLIAGGEFASAGGLSANSMAQWDGVDSQPLGSGLNYEYWDGSDIGSVHSLATRDGQLYAGGTFARSGAIGMTHIARWDGTSWNALGSGVGGFQGGYMGGTPTGIYSLEVINSELVAVGAFSSIGGVSAYRIARWNGLAWSSMGSGLNAVARDVVHYNGDLVAGGEFTKAGGVSANRVARWDGESWMPLGTGLNLTVWALAVYNGELVAGGQFTNRVSRWNGTSWVALGGGANGTVRALTIYNGDLIAGGDFTSIGGVSANRIARWNGSSWSPLGTGTSGESGAVHALAVYDGELIAGGTFVTAGGSTTNRIARWNGSSWSPLSTGMIGVGVYGLTVLNDELIAAGNFTSAGGTSANNIARWDGSSWDAMGLGLGGPAPPAAEALAVYNGVLFVGGRFWTAGGSTSAHLARWQACQPCAAADINCDGVVGVSDLLALLSAWGNCPPAPQPCPADIAPAPDGDGAVGVGDLLMLLQSWG